MREETINPVYKLSRQNPLQVWNMWDNNQQLLTGQFPPESVLKLA